MESCFRYAPPFLKAVINHTSVKRIAQSPFVSCSTFGKKWLLWSKGGAVGYGAASPSWSVQPILVCFTRPGAHSSARRFPAQHPPGLLTLSVINGSNRSPRPCLPLHPHLLLLFVPYFMASIEQSYKLSRTSSSTWNTLPQPPTYLANCVYIYTYAYMYTHTYTYTPLKCLAP